MLGILDRLGIWSFVLTHQSHFKQVSEPVRRKDNLGPIKIVLMPDLFFKKYNFCAQALCSPTLDDFCKENVESVDQISWRAAAD